MDYIAYKEILSNSSFEYRPSEVLVHHGVKGQKHGVRNALWYPIAAWKASLGRKPKTKAAEERREVNANKQEIAPVSKEQQIEELKKSILDSGDLTAVYQNKNLFTTQEIANAISRYNQITLLETAMKQQQGMKKVEVMKKIDNYGKAMGTASNAIQNTIKFVKAFDDAADTYTGFQNTRKKGGYLKVSEQKLEGRTNAEQATKNNKDAPKKLTKDDIESIKKVLEEMMKDK